MSSENSPYWDLLSAYPARTGHCGKETGTLREISPSGEDSRVNTAAQFLLQQLNLTPRQAQVLHWIAEGKTNAEIAVIMGCSFFTVKNHLKEIFQRLGVHSRTAAAACAYRAHIGYVEAMRSQDCHSAGDASLPASGDGSPATGPLPTA